MRKRHYGFWLMLFGFIIIYPVTVNLIPSFVDSRVAFILGWSVGILSMCGYIVDLSWETAGSQANQTPRKNDLR